MGPAALVIRGGGAGLGRRGALGRPAAGYAPPQGEVCALAPHTLTVRGRDPVGGAPVAIAALRHGPLVLDLRGWLLHLDPPGQVLRRWPLPGTPDKLNGSTALVVTGRAA
ncbi:hypothetical protein [Deinococcus hopiensis]|uniref:hypothetical protein n=1 Tax=Deinococcus hopiensis TaxID=309885 RepID=UPI000A0371F8|nr:hypothetical protein [Deinococcus hopiensis]